MPTIEKGGRQYDTDKAVDRAHLRELALQERVRELEQEIQAAEAKRAAIAAVATDLAPNGNAAKKVDAHADPRERPAAREVADPPARAPALDHAHARMRRVAAVRDAAEAQLREFQADVRELAVLARAWAGHDVDAQQRIDRALEGMET